jgi:Rrf2 family protein
MSRSTRFPAAVHVLTLLALKRGECCSSEWIAKSVGTNAVVVRRIVGLLQEAGLVTSRAGSQGGAMLEVDPDKITLRDIYDAVEEQSVFCMHQPHPKCPVACCVTDHVNELIEGAEEKMKKELAKTRLSSITKPASAQFRQMSK